METEDKIIKIAKGYKSNKSELYMKLEMKNIKKFVKNIENREKSGNMDMGGTPQVLLPHYNFHYKRSSS